MKKNNSQTGSISQQSDFGQPKPKKSKGFLIVLLLVLIVVVAALAGTIYYLVNNNDSENGPGTTNKRDTVVTLDNKDEILADLNNKVASGLFEIMMNVEWSFEDSSTPSEDAYVANNTTNTNTVYFDVTLDSTGETVYESPYIPVGSALQNIALKSSLAAGTYPCTLTYHLVDDDHNDINTVAVAVTLYIKN